MDRPLYPFTAVVGQERAKQAILCLAVEPRIGGVLLCGEKGTAKSTLVRALGGLEGVRLLELPVSATEDMLLGGVELEAARCAASRRNRTTNPMQMRNDKSSASGWAVSMP